MRPPRLAAAMLRCTLPRDARGRSIAGDLWQELEERASDGGRRRAMLWYWAQALELAGRYTWFRVRHRREFYGKPLDDPSGRDRRHVEVRALTREETMENFWTDLRYGVRMLFRTPTLSLVSILTIGLGIGLVSFTFSVVYGSVLRPMPVRDPDRFVMADGFELEGDATMRLSFRMGDYVAFRDQATVFEDLAAGFQGTVNVAGEDGPPERFDGAFLTANGLSILGVPPHLGRTFQPGEDLPGAEGTVVLGYDAWRNRYGGDESVIGRRIRVNGEPMTVIGVMPPGFAFPFEQEIWLTNRRPWEGLPRSQQQWVQAYGHLHEGVALETASEEMATIAARLADEFPDTNEGISARVTPYAEYHMPPEITAVLWLMLGATVGVMLIACANVANLLLARAALRTRDVAIRTALGANRFRVIRQLLTEALVLGLLGGAIGFAFAYIGMDFFNVVVAEIQKPYWIDMRVDLLALVFTAGITLLAAMIAGTLPALRASGAGIDTVLRDESRGSGLRIGRLSGVLVVGELAVSCALLIAAGFMVQSIVNTQTVDLGFEPDGLLTARIGLFETEYPTRADRQQFFRALQDRLEEGPGVRSAALTTNLPSTGAPRPQFAVEGVAYETDAAYPVANTAQISSGYFETMGAELIAGRELRPSESFWSPDTDTSIEPVALVNQSFVERFLDNGEPLGRRIRLGTGDSEQPWMRIVGVVPDQFVGGGVGGIGNDQVPPQQIYYPIALSDVRFLSMALRSQSSTEGLAASAREAVAGIDPNLPIYWVLPMHQVLADNSWAISLFGSLFTIFGVVALFLASVGLYGVMSFSVAQRRREMGVRMALGAEARDILRIVFGRVGVQLAVGLGLGMALAYALSGPLRFVMFGVETTDVGVYAIIGVTLALTGLLASFFPAQRASRVDPVTALRPE